MDRGARQATVHACVLRAKLHQSRPTLCNPVDCSLPGSSVPGIFQARILACVAISTSWGSSRPGSEPTSPILQAESLLLSHQDTTLWCN